MNFALPAIGEGQQIYVASKTLLGSALITLRYSWFFIVGIILADTVRFWQPALQQLASGTSVCLLILCLALLCAPSTISHVSDLIMGAGAAGLVAITLAYGANSWLPVWTPIL